MPVNWGYLMKLKKYGNFGKKLLLLKLRSLEAQKSRLQTILDSYVKIPSR